MAESPADFDYYGSVFNDVLQDLAGAADVEQLLARVVEGLADDAIAATGLAGAGTTPPDGSFDYIPIGVPLLLRELRALHQVLAADPDYACHGAAYRPVRFLEIGCGTGRNLAMIRHAGVIDWADLTGFDITVDLIAAGQKAFDLHDQISVADAMTYDYAPYDVIFSYRPFMDDAMQQRFEAYVEKSMKVSAYLLAPLSIDAKPSRRMQPWGATGNLWKKIA